jgi:hypothetical protein
LKAYKKKEEKKLKEQNDEDKLFNEKREEAKSHKMTRKNYAGLKQIKDL